MTSERGLLQNTTAAVIVGLCLAFVATLSWLGITKAAPFPRHPLPILGLAFSVFITGSIAYRSTFAGDRIVFGAATGAFALAGITAAFSLAPPVAFVVAVVKALTWTTAAVASAVLLVRSVASQARQ